MVDDDDGRRIDNGACLYYKLPYEPKGSAELTNAPNRILIS